MSLLPYPPARRISKTDYLIAIYWPYAVKINMCPKANLKHINAETQCTVYNSDISGFTAQSYQAFTKVDLTMHCCKGYSGGSFFSSSDSRTTNANSWHLSWLMDTCGDRLCRSAAWIGADLPLLSACTTPVIFPIFIHFCLCATQLHCCSCPDV